MLLWVKSGIIMGHIETCVFVCVCVCVCARETARKYESECVLSSYESCVVYGSARAFSRRTWRCVCV